MKKLNGVFGLVCIALMSVSCVNLDGQIDIKQSRPDILMVTFTIILFRVEVDFFYDHIEFSYFTGDEAVKDDLYLLDLIVREDPLRLQELGILPQSIILNRDI